jgi:hypothetical protein
MRRTVKMGAVAALIAGALLPTWGVGTSAAQHEHEHPTTTTTRPTTTTTRPTTTTTRPGTTTTTRPGTTTTTHGHPTTTTTRPGPTTTQMPGTPGARTSQVRYGPFNIPAAPDNPDGTHGHAHTGNRFQWFVQKPCSDCYVTSMTADLQYPDGRRAGYSTNAQLHHMVLANWAWGRSDATCNPGSPLPLGLLFGQRFFASGDERTSIRFPNGYGYRVGAGDVWNLIYELAGMEDVPQNVIINMTFEWVPASTAGMRDIEPVWLDVDQCGFSQISVPAGRSQRAYSWTVNRPGTLVAIGGHMHDGGENIAIRNDSTGQLICDSRAGYGESPLYIDHHGAGHISSMSKCEGPRVSTLTNGQRVTMTANYNMPAAVSDQMGIVMAFVTR